MSSRASDLWQQSSYNLRNLLAPGFCFVGSVGADYLPFLSPQSFLMTAIKALNLWKGLIRYLFGKLLSDGLGTKI